MKRDNFQSELSDCEIFRSLGSSDRERLSSLVRRRAFNKQEIVFLKGDPGFGLYLIRGGRVKICALDSQGAELVFTFLSKGDLLGDMAILDGKSRSATAIAVEDTDTLFLDRNEFLEFLRESPQACVSIIAMLCQRLRRLSTQLEEVSFLDVSGRIARKLIEMTKDGPGDPRTNTSPTYAISQEELARIIGASRVMVNKVLNSFVDLGLISIARKKLAVLDASELNRIACYDGEG